MGNHMTKPPKPRRVILNLAIQDLHIRHRFPAFTCHLHRGCGVWRGTLQPRLISPAYHIEISYVLKQVPKVKVISPPLLKGTPHLYRNGTLCLYWPARWWWQSDELIADTLIPWTASWLYFYELWLDTGDWLGPSSHDNPK